MTVTLTADQQDWVRVHVAKGEFASEEDAVRAQIERGETITLEESRRRNQLHMQALKRQWRA